MRAALVATLVLSSAPAFADHDPKLGDCVVVTKNSGRPLAWWRAPEGCKMKPKIGAPKLAADRAAVLENLECLDRPDQVKVAVDFAKDQLVMWTPSFSPRQTGVDAFDDGKTLTIVKLFGNVCPKDAPAKAGPVASRAFWLPKGPRTITEVSCNKVWNCR